MPDRSHPACFRDRGHVSVSSSAEMTGRQATVNARFVYIGAVVAQTGVQLIAPSLPAMRDALGLSDAQLALVTSVYLLSGALGAIPAGLLADRIGRRRVFGWSMVALGVLGIALQFATHSFTLFLAVRFVQGLAFAGLMPLTITILGDAFSGAALIGAHGRRTVAVHLGDGLLPMFGGMFVAVGWRAPWLGQLLAIPFGLLVLAKLTDPRSLSVTARSRIGIRATLSLFRSSAILSIQFLGFLRMFLKFGIVTFIPLLLIDERGLSPAVAGFAIGAVGLTAALPAVVAGWIARKGQPTTFVFAGTAIAGIALAVMALAHEAPVILVAAVIYGAADGLSAVYVNAFVSAATDAEHRGSFSAATGAIRNFAKFMAPATLGALTLVVPLSASFVVMALITIVSAFAALPLRTIEGRLSVHHGDR